MKLVSLYRIPNSLWMSKNIGKDAAMAVCSGMSFLPLGAGNPNWIMWLLSGSQGLSGDISWHIPTVLFITGQGEMNEN